MTNQRIALTFDIEGNIVENDSFLNLSQEQKLKARDFISEVMGAHSNVIAELTKNNKLVNSQFFVVDVGFDYFNYRDEQRLANPNHIKALSDEIGGAFNAVLSNIGAGMLVSEGAFAMSATFVSAPISAAIGGAVVVGIAGNILYDIYAKDEVSAFTKYIAENFVDGYVNLNVSNEGQSNINYTPLSGTNLTQSESQTKAIELLNFLSGGKVFGITPIKSVTINHSSSPGSASSSYSVESISALSKIADTFKIDIDAMLASNPFLQYRVSHNGGFILTTPNDGFKGNMFSFSPDFLCVSDFR